MKGLIRIPSHEEIARAYSKVQGGMPTLPELALWSQWSRFDPRLAEQLIAHFLRVWRETPPIALREAVLSEPWPEALAALLEQGRVMETWKSHGERALFRAWMACVVAGIRPTLGEQYFIGLAIPGGKRMARTAERPLKTFLKWGYLCEEVLANKAAAPGGPAHRRTWIGLEARLRVLKALAIKMPSFTIQDYLTELGGGLTPRQAQRDLKRLGGIKSFGQTRARRYRLFS